MRMRHRKTGGIYTVMALALEEATLEPVVVYCGATGQVWTRPASEFFDGRYEAAPDHPQQTVATPGVLQ